MVSGGLSLAGMFLDGEGLFVEGISRISGRRTTARRDEPFVVFMMGVRVNDLFAVRGWVSVLLSLRAMLREMRADPGCGLMGGRTYFSWRCVTLVQYWESHEALEAYARSPEKGHLPEWRRFNRDIRKSRAVGLWHEVFNVGSGEYEAIYADVPVSGLAKATRHIPAVGARESVRRRALRRGSAASSEVS